MMATISSHLSAPTTAMRAMWSVCFWRKRISSQRAPQSEPCISERSARMPMGLCLRSAIRYPICGSKLLISSVVILPTTLKPITPPELSLSRSIMRCVLLISAVAKRQYIPLRLRRPLPHASRPIVVSCPEENTMTQTAVLGGGCFWCVEAAFKQLQGVQRVVSGYMGGHLQNPSYEQVCGGNTGHVEVAEIIFDPAVISYEDLLEVFFTVHDPTTLNRQGNDVGEQYRSVIFYRDEEQHKTAQKVIAELTKERAFADPIVTTVETASTFYPAEDYHQDYFKNHPYQPYCMFTVSPKVKKIREKFAARLKA